MQTPRKIRKVFKSKPVIESAGVHLKRAFGFGKVPLFDPFLLLDDFRSENPEHYIKGFPWQGPIVMNTQEELKIAFEGYRKGTFVKHKKG